MRVFFYLIIVGIIIVSLYTLFSYRNRSDNNSNNNSNNKFKVSEKFLIMGSPDKPVITSLSFSNGTLNLSWNKPDSSTNITGYIVMIKKNNAIDDGLFMNFSSDTDCENCTYTINNLNLDNNSNYGVSVMAVNTIGSGTPSAILNFQTPEITLPPQPTQPIINVPVQTIMPTIFGEDKIKSGEEQRKNYLNDELQNMISRADGIYEINQDNLTYPNISIDDVKQSIHTINDAVKNDLQEYRLNIHLLNSKNSK